MSTNVESARREWEEGHRRFRSQADGADGARLQQQLEVVTSELRRRIGATFTVAQLAEVYDGAESWVREAIAENAPFPGWARTLSLVEDAAFDLYSHGAIDYEP